MNIPKNNGTFSYYLLIFRRFSLEYYQIVQDGESPLFFLE